MDASSLRKSLSRRAAALRKADKALRDAAALPEDLANHAYAADDVVRALDATLHDLEGDGRDLADFRDELRARTEKALADASAHLAARVADRLGRTAPVQGQLPELRWGLLRLEFRLTGPRREVVVWYGPRVAALGRADPEPDAVAEAAEQARAGLDRAALDVAAFAGELRQAYEVSCVRRGVARGGPVPIVDVLREVAVGRQPVAFRVDPIREHYASYGRVQFSYDLFRAGRRPELALGVAAHAQTKRPEDHLWIPTSEGGDGTHFATLAVRG